MKTNFRYFYVIFFISFFSCSVHAMTQESYHKLTDQLANFAEKVTVFILSEPELVYYQDLDKKLYTEFKGLQQILPALFDEVRVLSVDAYKNLSMITALLDIFKYSAQLFELEKKQIPQQIQPMLNYMMSSDYVEMKEFKKFKRRFPRGKMEKNNFLHFSFANIEILGECGKAIITSLSLDDLKYLRDETPELFTMIQYVVNFLMPYVAAYVFPEKLTSHDPTIFAFVTKLYVIQYMSKLGSASRPDPYDDVYELGTAAVYPDMLDDNEHQDCSFCDACKRREKALNRLARKKNKQH